VGESKRWTVGIGWEFNLLDNNGNIVGSATTDSDGDFFFNDVQVGEYTVEEVVQPGYYPLSPVGGVQSVTVISGTAVSIDFFNCTCPITGSIFSPGVSCFKDNNGTIDVNASGGVPPYTFSWSNGAATEDLSGLQPGTYSVTITDMEGCQNVLSTNVFEPDPLTCHAGVDQDVTTIGGNDGIATVNPFGGRSPFTFQWDENTGNQTTATANGLESGYYEVTVTDTNMCTSTCAVFISEPDPNDCPDLTPVSTLAPGNIAGNSIVQVAVSVNEVNGNDTDGSLIIVRIPSDPRFTFTWDPTLATAALIPLENNKWMYMGNNGFVHTWRFIGAGVLISGNGASAFGYVGMYDPQSTNGQTTVTATILPFSGGECNVTNNNDSEILVYFE